MIHRVWSGLAAVGSALILFAVAAGSPIPVLAALCALAVAEMAWGLWQLRDDGFRAPRAVLGGVALVAALGAVLFGLRILALIPFAALLVLSWGIALAAAVELRAKRTARSDGRSSRSRRSGRAGPLLAALGSGALIVAAITTPALASTDPGALAAPHGASLHDHR